MSIRVTPDMAQAAADEWGNHGARIRETEDGRWHWFCDCGDALDETDAVDEHTAAAQAEQHEFRAAIIAALDAAPTVPRVAFTSEQWWCSTCGNRYGEAVGELMDCLCSCGHPLTAVTLQLITRSVT